MGSNEISTPVLSWLIQPFAFFSNRNSNTNPNSQTALSFDETPFGVMIENYDLLLLVLSYIGPNQYRFTAGINTKFHEVYQTVYPCNTSTMINASTMELAKLCLEEHRSVIPV
jgi:hypothetical protein